MNETDTNVANSTSTDENTVATTKTSTWSDIAGNSWAADDVNETGESATDVGTEVGTEVDAEVDAEVGTEVDTEVGTEVDTEVVTEVDTEVDTEENEPEKYSREYFYKFGDQHTKNLRRKDICTFSWANDGTCLVISDYGKYEWADSRHSGTSKLVPFNGTYRQWCRYHSIRDARCSGHHPINRFCGWDVKIEYPYPYTEEQKAEKEAQRQERLENRNQRYENRPPRQQYDGPRSGGRQQYNGPRSGGRQQYNSQRSGGYRQQPYRGQQEYRPRRGYNQGGYKNDEHRHERHEHRQHDSYRPTKHYRKEAGEDGFVTVGGQ